MEPAIKILRSCLPNTLLCKGFRSTPLQMPQLNQERHDQRHDGRQPASSDISKIFPLYDTFKVF